MISFNTSCLTFRYICLNSRQAMSRSPVHIESVLNVFLLHQLRQVVSVELLLVEPHSTIMQAIVHIETSSPPFLKKWYKLSDSRLLYAPLLSVDNGSTLTPPEPPVTGLKYPCATASAYVSIF